MGGVSEWGCTDLEHMNTVFSLLPILRHDDRRLATRDTFRGLEDGPLAIFNELSCVTFAHG